ncbi:hypothetical protein CDAR_196361 [Caerostris darwini]|uniref:Uncharacterized protein n=1 Tax=Caerostris darwini TaxID=1538125 RepID=A0AAV4PYP8_9ARAC|nr:hypothetical protein CDAR_196361 [Caerostris darwini]
MDSYIVAFNLHCLIFESGRQIKTTKWNLDFNLISKIGNKAFFGSQIAKLSLKGNTQLSSIHEEAFLGLKNIRTL